MRLDEITGDDRFDKMLGGITGSDTPSVDIGNRSVEPDEKIMELTHKIFLALRDYNDPVIYQKFIDFMRKTLDPNIGPVTESKIDKIL